MGFILSSLKALQSVHIFINVSNSSFGEVHTASFYCMLNVNISSICNISTKNLLDSSNQNIFVVCSECSVVCCSIKPFLQTQLIKRSFEKKKRSELNRNFNYVPKQN